MMHACSLACLCLLSAPAAFWTSCLIATVCACVATMDAQRRPGTDYIYHKRAYSQPIPSRTPYSSALVASSAALSFFTSSSSAGRKAVSTLSFWLISAILLPPTLPPLSSRSSRSVSVWNQPTPWQQKSS